MPKSEPGYYLYTEKIIHVMHVNLRANPPGLRHPRLLQYVSSSFCVDILRGRAGGSMSPPSKPELVLRPALCLRGMPLGVGMPDFSSVSRRAVGVATLLPSLVLPVSTSRNDIDRDWE